MRSLLALGAAALLNLAACGPTPGPSDACGATGTICTVEGTGRPEFNGDGLKARDTSLYLPIDVTFDSEGRLLVVDWNNLRIRRLEADGTVKSIAGTGEESLAITNGMPATQVPLHHPYSVAWDERWNLFVAGNHLPAILEIAPDGGTFVVAGTPDTEGDGGDGGPALKSTMSYPCGVWPYEGGLLIADSGNDRVRRVKADGSIEAFAGTGDKGFAGDGGKATAAKLRNPLRVTVQGGRVLIVDSGNHAVREVLGDGSIRTIAGNGEEGAGQQLSTPRAAVIGPDGLLYIADAGNHRVVRQKADGALETVAGTAQGFSGDGGDAARARLNLPSGLAFQGADLYIADTGNHRVRRIVGAATAAAK